jgi:hypothetical protein
MSFQIDESYYAFAIGYYHGRTDGYERCPYPRGYDVARSFYNDGFRAGATAYCDEEIDNKEVVSYTSIDE